MVESISLSRQGFRIYCLKEGRPSLVKSFSGHYRIFRNYIQPENESPLEIISSFNDILVECKNDVAAKSRYFERLVITERREDNMADGLKGLFDGFAGGFGFGSG